MLQDGVRLIGLIRPMGRVNSPAHRCGASMGGGRRLGHQASPLGTPSWNFQAERGKSWEVEELQIISIS